jgi:hypothetical protein
MATVIAPLTITRVIILGGVLFAYLLQAGAAKDLSFSPKHLFRQLKTNNAPHRLKRVLLRLAASAVFAYGSDFGVTGRLRCFGACLR